MKRGKVLVGVFVATLMVGVGALVFFHVPFAEHVFASVGSWSVSSLTVNPYSSSQVSLQWSCSPTGTGINETVYEYYCTGSGCSPTTVYTSFNSTCPSSPTVQSITGTGNFAPGTSVTFQVCTGGVYGTCTNTASATTLPTNPGTLSATAQSQTSIYLSWGASSGASGYYIYRNGSYLTATGVTSFTNTGLSVNTSYSYYIVAYNSGGNSGASNTASATTLPYAPAVPGAPSVTPTGQYSMSLSWTAVSGATSYHIARWAPGIDIQTVSGTSFTDTTYSMACGTSYTYEIEACNAGGCSGWGASNSATTDACTPGTPTIGSNSGASQSTFNLTWSRNSPTDESGFQIGNAALVAGSAGGKSWTVAANGATSGSPSGYSCGQSDSFGVRAYVNTNGRTYYSGWSGTSNSATTDACTPGTPSGVTFTSYASQTYIPVSWTPTSPTDQSGFVATLNDSGLGMVVGSATAGPSATSVNVPMSCSSGGNSNYVQSYVNTNGRTYYSSPGTGASAKTSACTPGAPSASSISASSITITWPAVPLATYYHVSQNPPNLDVGTVTTNSFTASGLSCATSYTFMIYACDGPNNTTGCSPWGSPATITTSACPDTTPPTVSANNSSSGWYKTSPTITVSASDTGGSGLAFVKYTWNTSASYCWASGTSTSNGANLSIPGQGGNTLYLCAQDGAGNQSTWSGTYNLDTTAPSCGTWSPSSGTWHSSGSTTFTLSGSTDTGGSGINVSGGSCTTGTTNGSTCSVTISDNAGNTTSCTSPTNLVDPTPPTTSISASPSGWTSGNVTISVSASDTGGSGLSTTYYRCNTSNAWSTTASASFTYGCSLTGGQTAQAYSTDNAGNTGSTGSVNYYIDATAPATPSLSPGSAITNNSNITVSFSATDSGGSGLGGYRYCYTTNGSTCSPSTVGSSVTFSSVNSYTVCANAYDNAGNTSGTTCSSANAYQYTSVSAPSSSGITVNTAPVSGLSAVNSTWSGTASGFNVYIQGGQYSTPQLLSSSAASSGNTNAINLQCPGNYTLYTVAYNTDTSLGGGTSASCSGSWGSITNAQCTVKTGTIQLRTCTQGFFGQ